MTRSDDAQNTRALLERLARLLDGLAPERRKAFGTWLVAGANGAEAAGKQEEKTDHEQGKLGQETARQTTEGDRP